jgi:membrane protein
MAEGRFARSKNGAVARSKALREQHAWLRHLVAAWGLMQRNNGNQYAAAITFFSFLALFPLVLLAVSITGFVLHSDPQLQRDFFNHITQNVPGPLGSTLKQALQTAIKNRSGVGIIGLVGVLLTGLGWIGNLRAAIDAVWGRTPPQVNFFKAKLQNLIVLAGLGLGAVVSVGLTVVGTSVTDQILRALSLDSVPGATLLLKLLGIALAIGGDMLIGWWVLIRMPQRDVPVRTAITGVLLASVGFEVLKIVGSFTIVHTANSPTAGPFAGVIAILVWIQLVARWLLLSCAWMATVTAEKNAALLIPVVQPADEVPDIEAPAVSPAAVGVTLVGAGVVAGAAATWVLARPRPRPRPGPRRSMG